MPKAGRYAHWRPPVVNDLCFVFVVCYDVHSDCIFQVLVGSAIIFRIFLINVFTLCTLVFVHHFCVARCLTPRPLVHLRRVGECVGLTFVAPGKVPICHTLRSVASTPSPSKMRHVLMLACTCGGKQKR